MNGASLHTSRAGNRAETGTGENGTGSVLGNTRQWPERGRSEPRRRRGRTASGQPRKVPSTQRDTGRGTGHQKTQKDGEAVGTATGHSRTQCDRLLRSQADVRSAETHLKVERDLTGESDIQEKKQSSVNFSTSETYLKEWKGTEIQTGGQPGGEVGMTTHRPSTTSHVGGTTSHRQLPPPQATTARGTRLCTSKPTAWRAQGTKQAGENKDKARKP